MWRARDNTQKNIMLNHFYWIEPDNKKSHHTNHHFSMENLVKDNEYLFYCSYIYHWWCLLKILWYIIHQRDLSYTYYHSTNDLIDRVFHVRPRVRVERKMLRYTQIPGITRHKFWRLRWISRLWVAVEKMRNVVIKSPAIPIPRDQSLTSVMNQSHRLQIDTQNLVWAVIDSN